MSKSQSMWPEFEEFSTHNNALRMRNLQSICRLCMVNCGAAMEPIFRNSIARCIADKIAGVTRLTLRQGDGLPALVCQQCIFQLDVADAFIQRCKLSDKSLRSLLPQQQTKPCSAESTLVPFVDHVIQPQPTADVFDGDPETLPDNIVQRDLDFPHCAPTFEAVDLALPEHLILDDGSNDEGAEHNSDESSLTANNANQGIHLLSRDPLLGIKCETLIETESCEGTEEGTHVVKVEVLENNLIIKDSSDGAFNEDLDGQDNCSMKTEDLTGLVVDSDMNGEDNIVCIQNAPNFVISTTARRSEQEAAPPANQKRFQPASKKYPCPICFHVLANKWSLKRHKNIHTKNEKLKQMRLAYGPKKNSLPIPHSEIIRPVRTLPESEGLDTSQSATITPCLGTEDIAGSTLETPDSDAQEISIPSKVPREIHVSSETTRQHKCMICSSTFARHWNLVRHRERHNKKVSSVYLKKKSSNSQQSIADQKSNQLNMIPIVKVTPLIITKDGIQVANSLKQFNFKQPLIFSAKQSPAGQIEPCERILTQGNMSPSVQKSAGGQQVEAPFEEDGSSKKCRVCKLVCRNSSRLKSHMKSHTGERPFKCTLCKKRYQGLCSLKRHMRDHTEDGEFKCRKCHSTFRTVYQLRRHEAIHALHKCLDCGKTFSNNWYLKAHSVIHSDARPWSCSQCGSVFKRLYDLLKHQRRHILKCKINAMGSSAKIIQKKNTHKLKTNKSQVCKNKPFNSQGLTKNTKGLNNNNLLLQNSRRAQTQKMKLAFGNADSSQYKCETCGKAFKEKRSLKNHSVVHSTENPWKCELCGFAYKFRPSLRKHMLRHHRQQKTSSFDSSTKPKPTERTEEHKTNTSVYYNRLPILQEATNVTQALVENTKKCQSSSKPRNLRPHKCPTCGKTFKASTTLKFHILTHSNERPWKCEQCNFSFKRRDSLVRHVKVRKHVTSIREITLENKHLCSRVTPTSTITEQNNFSQTSFPKNQEQITSMVHEPSVPELLFRSEVSAKACKAMHYSDRNSTEAHEPIITGPPRLKQAVKSEILAKNDCSRRSEILKKMHECRQTELSSLPEEDIGNEANEPVCVEKSIHIEAEILTNNNHVKLPEIHKEMDESSFTECFPLQEATAHTENISVEPLGLINAEFSPDLKLEILPDSILEEEIFQEDINECSHNELFPLKNSRGNIEVIDSGACDHIFARSLVFATTSEILTEDHETNNETSESSPRELFLLQEATSEISREVDTGYHRPIVTENSDDTTSCGDKQHLRRNEMVNEISTHANDLYSPSSPHLMAGNQRNTTVLDQLQRPFNCTHCDKTFRYLHELIKHTSGHGKKESFHCSQCSASFYRKCHLRNHINRHSTVKWQKSRACAMESKSNSDLKVHTVAHSAKTARGVMYQTQNFYCKDREDIAIIPTPFSPGNASQRSNSEDNETFYTENPSKLQSSILLKALSCSTTIQNIGNGESLEMPNTNSNKNFVPISYKQLRINDQPIQVAAKKNENNMDVSLEFQRICINTTASEEKHENSAASLNLQNSSTDKNCLNGVIYPLEQVSNIKCESEKRKAEMPLGLAQPEGDKSQLTREKPYLRVTEFASEQNFQHQITSLLMQNTHHQPKVALEGNVCSANNAYQNAGFSGNVVDENLEQNSKSFSKLLDEQKNCVVPLNVDTTTIVNISTNKAQNNDIVVPFNIGKLTIINASTNNASFIITSSGIVPLKEPHLGLSFLGTEFSNQPGAVECTPAPGKNKDFECKICGKQLSSKGFFNNHMKSHMYQPKNFECEGCNRPFNVTGSLGCNCLAS